MWLIIGGSGFIGVNFSKFLLEKGYNFRNYDIKKSKYLPKKVETIIGNIRDKKKLSKAMNGCNTIFHLATVPPSKKISRDEIYDIDVNGTRNILETAKKNNIKRIVFTSSASHVYGLINKDKCPLKEECSLNPINEYGKNKVIQEDLFKKAADNYNFKTIVLRLSMVLGPYNFDPILFENIISLFKNKRIIIPGNGHYKAQSIHVNDVNTALLASGNIFENLTSNNVILNISSEEILSINEFINQLRTITNSKSKVTHLPYFLAKGIVSFAWWFGRTKIHPSYLGLISQDQTFDIRKARNILKWKPEYSNKKALEDTVEFIRAENY